jgi:excisionase family DNA binding protein
VEHIITQSECAKLCGVSRQYIYKLVRDGKISSIAGGKVKKDEVLAYRQRPQVEAPSLVGGRYGRWTVLSDAKVGNGPQRWYCRCDCGKEATIIHGGLLNGASRSCGCLRKELLKQPRSPEIIGMRFFRLTVLSKEPYGSNPASRYLCRCDCGTEKVVYRKNLTNGAIKSCGCLRGDSARARAAVERPIQPSRTKEYSIYKGAKRRCNGKHAVGYHHYGGRGIEFRFESFQQFLDAVGPHPGPGYSLERIDNNGHYEPNNVRWATVQEQNQNKRRCGYCPHDCKACPFGAPPRDGKVRDVLVGITT